MVLLDPKSGVPEWRADTGAPSQDTGAPRAETGVRSSRAGAPLTQLGAPSADLGAAFYRMVERSKGNISSSDGNVASAGGTVGVGTSKFLANRSFGGPDFRLPLVDPHTLRRAGKMISLEAKPNQHGDGQGAADNPQVLVVWRLHANDQ
jgi:hypothetical protein